MANEIRVLEDQLYEADYQNRVLRDKLERAGMNHPGDVVVPDHASSYAPLIESSSEPLPPTTDIPMDGPINADPFSYELPPDDDPDSAINDSTESPPFVPPPIRSESPQPLSDPPMPVPDAETSDISPEKMETPDGQAGDAAAEPVDPADGLLPPPSQPEPPGPDDLNPSPEIPGEIIPPGEAVPDPDRVIVPKGSKFLRYPSPPGMPTPPPNEEDVETISVPDHLELHKAFSGGQQTDGDDEVDGMYLVINALDEKDRIVDLSRFDVDAALTVVAVDPTIEGDDQRIARWEFTPDEVREMVQSKPVDGLHLSVQWQGTIPATDDVVVHVRLKAAEQEMRCQGKVSVAKSVAMSHWLPRAGERR